MKPETMRELTNEELNVVAGGVAAGVAVDLSDLGGILSSVTGAVSGLLTSAVGAVGGLLSTVVGTVGGLVGGLGGILGGL